MVVVTQFLAGNLLALQGTPGVDDVGEHEGDENRDVSHHLEREGTRRAVGYGERALQVGERRIVGRVVPARTEQQGRHREHRARAGKPDAPARDGREHAAHDAPQHEHDANQKRNQHGRHGKQVVQIFEGFHIDFLRRGVDGKTVAHQRADKESQEKQQEGERVAKQPAAAAHDERVIADAVQEVQPAQNARQIVDGDAEHPVPDVEQDVDAVPRVGPAADDGHREVAHVALVNHKVRPGEEGGHGRAQQQRAENAVEHQEALPYRLPFRAVHAGLKLVGHGLKHEREQNEHPGPIGTAEAGAVEQREGSEEGSAKGHQRGERELPLAPGGVDEQRTLFGSLAQLEEQRVSALHEKQEHQQSPQQRDEEPPIML